jgi:hypothetical protein
MDFLFSIFSFFTGGGDGSGGHTRPSGPILD